MDWYNIFRDRIGQFDNYIYAKHKSNFELFDVFLKELFRIREILYNKDKHKKNNLLDTLGFYIDMFIEDFSGLKLLVQKGFFSTSSAILRRLQLTLARALYLTDNPDKCNAIREGKIIRDKTLIEYLDKSGESGEGVAYSELCNSTHLNYIWATYAKDCNILSPVDEKSYLCIEAIILQSHYYAIRMLIRLKNAWTPLLNY